MASAGLAYLWLEELGNPFVDDGDGWRPRYEALLQAEGATRTARLHAVPEPFAPVR